MAAADQANSFSKLDLKILSLNISGLRNKTCFLKQIIYKLGVTRSILNGFFFESIVLAPISKFSVNTGSRFSTTKFSMCHYNQT